MNNLIGEIQNRYRTAYKLKTNQILLQDINKEDQPTISRMVQELNLDELQVGGWGFHNTLR